MIDGPGRGGSVVIIIIIPLIIIIIIIVIIHDIITHIRPSYPYPCVPVWGVVRFPVVSSYFFFFFFFLLYKRGKLDERKLTSHERGNGAYVCDNDGDDVVDGDGDDDKEDAHECHILIDIGHAIADNRGIVRDPRSIKP